MPTFILYNINVELSSPGGSLFWVTVTMLPLPQMADKIRLDSSFQLTVERFFMPEAEIFHQFLCTKGRKSYLCKKHTTMNGILQKISQGLHYFNC